MHRPVQGSGASISWVLKSARASAAAMSIRSVIVFAFACRAPLKMPGNPKTLLTTLPSVANRAPAADRRIGLDFWLWVRQGQNHLPRRTISGLISPLTPVVATTTSAALAIKSGRSIGVPPSLANGPEPRDAGPNPASS